MKEVEKFCYADVGGMDFVCFRMFGPGLGNLLFPWARATAYARSKGYSLLPTTWPQLKWGPIVRRELDSRMYMSLFKRQRDTTSNLTKVRQLAKRRMVQEIDKATCSPGQTIRFSGMNGLFEPFLSDWKLIRSELWAMTQEAHRPEMPLGGRGHFSVAVHIRLGDFRVLSDHELRSGTTNGRIPLTWYEGIICGLNELFGDCVRCTIYSDGRDEELAPILRLPNCSRADARSAMYDLWAISQSDLLIASGSTFSMWGSFLGRLPTMWYPGQMKGSLSDGQVAELEIEPNSSLSSHRSRILEGFEQARRTRAVFGA